MLHWSVLHFSVCVCVRTHIWAVLPIYSTTSTSYYFCAFFACLKCSVVATNRLASWRVWSSTINFWAILRAQRVHCLFTCFPGVNALRALKHGTEAWHLGHTSQVVCMFFTAPGTVRRSRASRHRGNLTFTAVKQQLNLIVKHEKQLTQGLGPF